MQIGNSFSVRGRGKPKRIQIGELPSLAINFSLNSHSGFRISEAPLRHRDPPSVSAESEAGGTAACREAAAHCCCQAQILLKGRLAPAGEDRLPTLGLPKSRQEKQLRPWRWQRHPLVSQTSCCFTWEPVLYLGASSHDKLAGW